MKPTAGHSVKLATIGFTKTRPGQPKRAGLSLESGTSIGMIDLTGKSFGRLVVRERAGADKGGHARWRCLCLCGRETIVEGGSLRRGDTASCGCIAIERGRDQGLSNIRHGHSTDGGHSPTYHSWHAMTQRCTNPKHKGYPNYGGRGIKICERWRKFSNFLADMGERPEGKTLDRKDNDGNYEPGNCRWATYGEQNSNQRRRFSNSMVSERTGEARRRGFLK